MDAHAHLLSLGWAGPGHSLDSKPYKQKGHRGLAYDPARVGNNGNGLVKPLSISHRHGRFGIGKRAHEPQAGNEWWLKGFESALGNIGKSESERSSGTSTPMAREHAGKHGGLYGFFIKGQQMEGTIHEIEEIKQSSKKRKSEALDETTGGHTPKFIELEVGTSTAEFQQAGAFFAVRDKDERRFRRTERPSPVAEFEQVGEYLEVQGGKSKRKNRNLETIESEGSTPLEIDRLETKEERRERRRLRKEKKELELKALADLENHRYVKSKNDLDTEVAAANAARKAERKRRKAETAARYLEESCQGRPQPC